MLRNLKKSLPPSLRTLSTTSKPPLQDQFSLTFDHATVEKEQQLRWKESSKFRAQPRSGREPFAIVLPPPNVTGFLHVGHALCFSLQDVIARFERMRGKDVLFEPGTDHAGIATQMVVQKMLAKEGTSREKVGREEFIRRVWEWKETSGGTIYSQMQRLGASLDWERPKFTMDPKVSSTVISVFVRLYNEGLIYRSKKLVNWDAVLQTAVSDLEVEQRKTEGKLWRIRYELEKVDGVSPGSITVATTRPETLLGDTGVAVHPEDARFSHLIGTFCIVPIVNRRVPIVADSCIDPNMGTGAVKVTPAHDFTDFEIGLRHNLPQISIFDERARVVEEYGQFAKLGWEEARCAIVNELERLGALEGVSDHSMTLPFGDRLALLPCRN